MQHDPLGPDERIIIRIAADMSDIVPEFLDNARNDILTLREAITHEDYEAVLVLGHGMKGVGDFGFEYIARVGASLEQAARARNCEDIEQLTGDLATYLERAEVVFD